MASRPRSPSPGYKDDQPQRGRQASSGPIGPSYSGPTALTPSHGKPGLQRRDRSRSLGDKIDGHLEGILEFPTSDAIVFGQYQDVPPPQYSPQPAHAQHNPRPLGGSVHHSPQPVHHPPQPQYNVSPLSGSSHHSPQPVHHSPQPVHYSPQPARPVAPPQVNPLDFAIGTLLPQHRQAASLLYNYKPHDLNREKQIAKGSFGVVYFGKVLGINETVVIKDLQVVSDDSFREWENEINVMSQHNCQFVTKIFGYCNNDPTLSLIVEYFPKGDLFGILHKKADQHPLSTLQRLRMSRHVCFGVTYLHSSSLMHRDIKSMNVLVTDDYSCKLADFGTAKLVASASFLNTANTGSPLWMAPEVKKGIYSFAADIYSLGLVLYEILLGQIPPWEQSLHTVVLPLQFPWSGTILPCCDPDPHHRLTAQQISGVIDGHIRKTIVQVMTALNTQQKAALQQAHGDIPAQLEVIYKYLLSIPAPEAEALVAKAFVEGSV